MGCQREHDRRTGRWTHLWDAGEIEEGNGQSLKNRDVCEGKSGRQHQRTRTLLEHTPQSDSFAERHGEE